MQYCLPPRSAARARFAPETTQTPCLLRDRIFVPHRFGGDRLAVADAAGLDQFDLFA